MKFSSLIICSIACWIVESKGGGGRGGFSGGRSSAGKSRSSAAKHSSSSFAESFVAARVSRSVPQCEPYESNACPATTMQMRNLTETIRRMSFRKALITRSNTEGLNVAILSVDPNDIDCLDATYKSQYGEGVIDALGRSVVLESSYTDLLGQLLMPDLAEGASREISRSFRDHTVLTATLIGRSTDEIHQIRKQFYGITCQDLSDFLKAKVGFDSGSFWMMLTQGLSTVDGDDAYSVDADVEEFYTYGGGRLGTWEIEFMRILANRSPEHLRKVFAAYQEKYKTPFREVIEDEYSFGLEDVLGAAVDVAIDRNAYFAGFFRYAIRMNHVEALHRLILRFYGTQDMENFKAAFKAKYNKDLVKEVQSVSWFPAHRGILRSLVEKVPATAPAAIQAAITVAPKPEAPAPVAAAPAA